MQPETHRTTEVLVKKLPLASRLEQMSSKDPHPSLFHQNPPFLLYFLILWTKLLSCFLKQCAKEIATLCYSTDSYNFFPPPGHRPLVRERFRKKKKKSTAVKVKKQQTTVAWTKPSLNPLSAPAVTLAFKSKGGCHRMQGQCTEEYKAGGKKGNQMNSELRWQGSHLLLVCMDMCVCL